MSFTYKIKTLEIKEYDVEVRREFTQDEISLLQNEISEFTKTSEFTLHDFLVMTNFGKDDGILGDNLIRYWTISNGSNAECTIKEIKSYEEESNNKTAFHIGQEVLLEGNSYVRWYVKELLEDDKVLLIRDEDKMSRIKSNRDVLTTNRTRILQQQIPFEDYVKPIEEIHDVSDLCLQGHFGEYVSTKLEVLERQKEFWEIEAKNKKSKLSEARKIFNFELLLESKNSLIN